MPVNRSSFVRTGDVVLHCDFEDVTPICFDRGPCQLLDEWPGSHAASHIPGNWPLTKMAGFSTPSGAIDDRDNVK